MIAPVLALSVLLLAGLGLARLVSARRSGSDRAWSVRTEIPQEAAASPMRPATEGEVARALAGIEGRMFARSPALGVGVAFCVLIIGVFVVAFGAQNSMPWATNLQYLAWYVHPLTGLTLLGAFRAVTRARRDGAEELVATCATTADTRTLGHLASAWMPLAVSTVFLAVVVTGTALADNLVHGPIAGDDLLDAVTAALLPAGGVAVGVALGRWLPYTIAPIVVVASIAVATGAINGIGGHDWNPYVALTTAPTVEGPSPVFSDRPAAFHLLWILSLVGLVAVVALLHDRRDRLVKGCALAVGVLVLAAGFGVTRPMSSNSAGRIADLVASPERHQICTSASPQVQVCTFNYHRDLLPTLVSSVAPTAAAVPAEAGSFTIRQRFLGDFADLPPEVRVVLGDLDLTNRPGNEIALLEVPDVGNDDVGPALALALGAAGLPDRVEADLVPQVAAGEARGVVALWLAVRGVDPGGRSGRLVAGNPASADPFERGLLGSVGDCFVPAVVWSAQDLEAARAIVGLPDATVRPVLASEWDRWTDPATSTDDLLVALGLDPVGPFDAIEPQRGNPC